MGEATITTPRSAGIEHTVSAHSPIMAALAAANNLGTMSHNWCELGVESLDSRQREPVRTVFFPAPPVDASARTYHTGHLKPWTPKHPGSTAAAVAAVMSGGLPKLAHSQGGL